MRKRIIIYIPLIAYSLFMLVPDFSWPTTIEQFEPIMLSWPIIFLIVALFLDWLFTGGKR